MADDLEKLESPVSMLDPYQIWKRLYFAFEESLTSTVKESVSTGSFANGIDLILNSYLQYLKLQKDFITPFVDESPFSSKRDVARVAELVVSLENKVDILENELDERLEGIENQSDLWAEQLAALPATLSEADFNKVFNPAMAAVKDIGKRVGNLEKVVKKIDTNLTAMSRLIISESKKKVPVPPAAKPPKPNPPTATT